MKQPETSTQQQLDLLSNLQLSILDEDETVPDAEVNLANQSPQDVLNAALASGFGLVDKIDFSSLKFEDDDE